MSTDREKSDEIFKEVLDILRPGKKHQIKVSLQTAYWTGVAIISTLPANPLSERNKILHGAITEIGKVIPPELIDDGEDQYKGDLTILVPIALNQNEVNAMGQAILTLPSGRDIINALPIDKNDRAIFDGMRNRQISAYLTICDEFQKNGGELDEQIKKKVEEELS